MTQNPSCELETDLSDGEMPSPALSQRPPGLLLRSWLILEMLALFFGLPAVIAVLIDPQDRARGTLDLIRLGWLCDVEVPRGLLVFPVLLTTTIAIVLSLALSPTFRLKQLWNRTEAKRGLRRVLVLFVINAVVLLGLTWLLAFHTEVLPASGFLRLPREAPLFLPFLFLVYPILSAYPQEITHRAFFFHRYRPLFPGRWLMITVNAFAFMWLHVMFWNWVALVLTLGGGFLFAYTYDRCKSTLLAGIEHGLYGNWIFFTGLGWFVYAGSVDQIPTG